MKVWFLHIFYSNIHSNSFTLRLQISVNVAFQLLITLERKHLGLSVNCFGKLRCQIIKNLKFELHQGGREGGREGEGGGRGVGGSFLPPILF